MLGKSGLIFVQAVHLMLFLFLFFPRYTGTISFAMGESKIGLTDTVSPGSIAKLSQDDSEALYVQFVNGTVPTTDTMYMRGLVLWDYNKGNWTPGELASFQSRKAVRTVAGADEIKQRITIRPHNQKWLFALDIPVSVPVNDSESNWATMLNSDIVQLAAPNGKLNHQARYSVTSSPERPEEQIKPEELDAGTRLPDIDPGVSQLADSLHRGLGAGQEQAYIANVLKYFHHGGFTYSAAPGEQGKDSAWLAVFLLHSKTGFCEHFASAFAVLMRLQKIPARLVVGYLGGDYNPYSDNYVISQSNAHAWDEVWLPSTDAPAGSNLGRWVRVDPTALIPTTELSLLVSRASDATDSLSRQIAQHKPTFAEAFLPTWARNALKEMQLRREQIEANWDDLVFSYDPEAQVRLAQALGFGERASFELLMLCLVTAGICFIAFKKWMARKPHVSPVENLYASFCRNMARRGIPRVAWEGPLAYTERVAEAFPDDQRAIHRIGSIVARARYGPAPYDLDAPDHLKSLLTVLTAPTTSREPS
jgi:protein-glutamine gamma-glutamyltransferase